MGNPRTIRASVSDDAVELFILSEISSWTAQDFISAVKFYGSSKPYTLNINSPGGDPFAPGDNGAPPGARPADAPPPNRERTTASARKTYLGVMGLKPGATMDDVKKAFRTFSGPQKGHPDKGGDPATYKRWTEAMSWLKKHGVADEDGAGDG